MKTMIRISGVVHITDKRVKVILADTGEELWLPRKEAERFGNRVYIPDWLAQRYKQLRHYEPIAEKPMSGV